MINFKKKIKIIKNNHLNLNQNWNFISKKLSFFNDINGKINFYEWLDKEIKEKKITKKWSGFLHNVIDYPIEYPEKYKNKIFPLSSLVKNYYFLDKLESCDKIFVFTKQIENFLIKETSFKNVKSIIHPIPDFIFAQKKWTKKYNKILHIGQQLRKYHSFLDLKTELNKIIIKPLFGDYDLIEMRKYSKNSNTVSIINQVSINKYFELLSKSIVFLDLYDAAACNTVLECIALNIPILIRKIEGVMEYLGKDYPFYFENLNEANYKLSNSNLILRTHNYISEMNKERYSINNFLKNTIKNI